MYECMYAKFENLLTPKNLCQRNKKRILLYIFIYVYV